MRQVEIRVEGCMDKNWDEWLEGFEIIHVGNNETLLAGKVEDQSVLYGMIAKLRDLGVKLLSVNSIPQPSKEETQSAHPSTNHQHI
jgi:hypothetical protein